MIYATKSPIVIGISAKMIFPGAPAKRVLVSVRSNCGNARSMALIIVAQSRSMKKTAL